jgi:hypothetical protein
LYQKTALIYNLVMSQLTIGFCVPLGQPPAKEISFPPPTFKDVDARAYIETLCKEIELLKARIEALEARQDVLPS